MIIRCPWPPTELRPNFKRANHWSKYAGKAKKYRHACWAVACEQNAHRAMWPDNELDVTMKFYPPTGCRWDEDAMFSAFKSGQDGIADAMGVDDKRFRLTKTVAGRVSEGCVIVRIETPALIAVPLRGVIR